MTKIIQLNTLRKLLMPWVSEFPVDLVLENLKLDSRTVTLGDLFIAVKGFNTNGYFYIDHAIEQGAVAILLETNGIENYNQRSVPIIYFYKLHKYVSSIAGRFYGHPSLFLTLVGITGTNGKTTIAHLLANWMELVGEKSAVMGTLGSGMLNNIKFSSVCTTSSAIDIQKTLMYFIKNKVKFVSMEVSSHGLDQCRVDALYFNVAIFSNLSHDHLDYHGNIKQYETVKWKLFHKLHVENFVINIDDDVGYKWLSYLPTAVAVTTTDRLPKSWSGLWISLTKAKYSLTGTDIFFSSSWGKGIIHSQLLGVFNVNNLLLALGALLIIGYPLSLLLSYASYLNPVCGRLEILQSYDTPRVIIDYAHSPDALKKVLSFVQLLCKGKRIWSIFGCGGDRDRWKRPIMGYIAERYSDYVIITNDNPRNENPECIIHDIMQGIRNLSKVIVIQDRALAINFAIKMARAEDFILVFGKGHEKYQIIKDECIKYSDHDIVKNSFNTRFCMHK